MQRLDHAGEIGTLPRWGAPRSTVWQVPHWLANKYSMIRWAVRGFGTSNGSCARAADIAPGQ